MRGKEGRNREERGEGEGEGGRRKERGERRDNVVLLSKVSTPKFPLLLSYLCLNIPPPPPLPSFCLKCLNMTVLSLAGSCPHSLQLSLSITTITITIEGATRNKLKDNKRVVRGTKLKEQGARDYPDGHPSGY